MYPFEYELTEWVEDEERYNKVRGITFADDLAGAAKNIEKYYGYDIAHIDYLSYASGDEEFVYEFGGAQESLDHAFEVRVVSKKVRD